MFEYLPVILAFLFVLSSVFMKPGIILLLQILYSGLFAAHELYWISEDFWAGYDSYSVVFWVCLECAPFIIFFLQKVEYVREY